MQRIGLIGFPSWESCHLGQRGAPGDSRAPIREQLQLRQKRHPNGSGEIKIGFVMSSALLLDYTSQTPGCVSDARVKMEDIYRKCSRMLKRE